MILLLRPPQARIPYSLPVRNEQRPGPQNVERSRTLVQALQASAGADLATLRELCTKDITASGPGASLASIDEVLAEVARRDLAFSNVVLQTAPLDVGGDDACVEWSVTMTHTGKFQIGDDIIDPTNAHITLDGVTVAEFQKKKIRALRQYWDGLSLLEQLGLVR